MFYLFFVLFLVVLDVFAKQMAFCNLKAFERIPVIKKVLNLTLVKNYGAAFGIMQNSNCFFIIFAFIASFIFLILLIKSKNQNKFYKFCYVLLASGSIGNLIDRISKGFVVDFLDLDFINFPVFNFADIYITLGFGLLSIFYLFSDFWHK